MIVYWSGRDHPSHHTRTSMPELDSDATFTLKQLGRRGNSRVYIMMRSTRHRIQQKLKSIVSPYGTRSNYRWDNFLQIKWESFSPFTKVSCPPAWCEWYTPIYTERKRDIAQHGCPQECICTLVKFDTPIDLVSPSRTKPSICIGGKSTGSNAGKLTKIGITAVRKCKKATSCDERSARMKCVPESEE